VEKGLPDNVLHALVPVVSKEPVPWDEAALQLDHLRAHVIRVGYAQYLYGLLCAARTARAVGLREFSAIEFGVAGGNGLVACYGGTRHGRRAANENVYPHFSDSIPLPPEKAQLEIPVEQYAEMLGKLKPQFIHHPESKRHLQAIVSEMGCDLERTYFEQNNGNMKLLMISGAFPRWRRAKRPIPSISARDLPPQELK